MKHMTPPPIFRSVMSRLRDIGKIALMLSFVSVALLGCGGGGGSGGLPPLTLPEATAGANTFTIADANIVVGSGQTHALNSVIDGLDGADTFELGTGGVVASISFNTATPTGGNVHLQNIETITINGGMVNSDITGSSAGETFTLGSGTIGGDVNGGGGDDRFVIGSAISVTGMIDGGAGGDTLSLLAGFTPTSANLFEGVLSLGITGGGLTFTVANIETYDIPGLTRLPRLILPGSTAEDDVIAITSNINIVAGAAGQTHVLDSVIDGGGGGRDVFQLDAGAVVSSIAFADTAPADGAVHLQNIEFISISGDVVAGIDAREAPAAGVVVNFLGGTVGGSVIGSEQADTFVLRGGAVSGMIDGGGGEGRDAFSIGVVGAPATVRDVAFSAGDSAAGDVHLQNIDIIRPVAGAVRNITGSDQDESFAISSEIGSDITISGVIDGGGGTDADELQVNFGATVASIAFAADPAPTPTAGQLLLQNIETIMIDRGTVTGAIDASAASAGVTFNLNRGMVGSVTGSDNVDSFVIGSGIMVSGTIDGGAGTDTIRLTEGFIPDTAELTNNVLTLVFNGNSREFTLNNIDRDNVDVTRLALTFPATGNRDDFTIAHNIVGATRTRTLDSVINGGGGIDALVLNTGAVVSSISFNSNLPVAGSGNVHLQNVETIQINGGRVNVDITGSSGDENFFLQDGAVDGNVFGGDGNDFFSLFSAIRIGGYIDGGGHRLDSGGNPDAGGDTLRFTGAATGSVFLTPGQIPVQTRGGLVADGDITNGDGSVRNIETQDDVGNIESLSVRGIESLALSPALNLYGALSDALMQFGQQTAEGFALADLNPQTGRLTQLMSKASPFTKGHIWAHKITHSGNGKGSIGLALTGLTARANSDYDYEMNLTQHGFDAPVVSSQWGDFGLRAVSHTMTGTIETNTAEAQVSGYGAGVSLLWRSRELRSLPRHNLTAHVTALAGGYEVDAHTSPLNPQAVINEVSEGSFSAINAVISAGVADKRELANGLVMRTTADVSWQTLSLDDFSETGENGIVVNFDKATRFTARIGAGLEGEHWFSDLAFVHETSSGGTLSSGLSQDYRQHDGTAIEMKFGGKVADLATGLTLKAFMAWRQSVAGLAGEPSAQFELLYRF